MTTELEKLFTGTITQRRPLTWVRRVNGMLQFVHLPMPDHLGGIQITYNALVELLKDAGWKADV